MQAGRNKVSLQFRTNVGDPKQRDPFDDSTHATWMPSRSFIPRGALRCRAASTACGRQDGECRGESLAPIVCKIRWWRKRASVVLMRTNAQLINLILTKTTNQGQILYARVTGMERGSRASTVVRTFCPADVGRMVADRRTNDADSRVAPLTGLNSEYYKLED